MHHGFTGPRGGPGQSGAAGTGMLAAGSADVDVIHPKPWKSGKTSPNPPPDPPPCNGKNQMVAGSVAFTPPQPLNKAPGRTLGVG